MATNTELWTAIADLVTSAYPPDEPGVAVIAVRDGATLYRGGSGWANEELEVPIAPDMVFRLGSITKQFTAVAVLMLMEQGNLALDDPLTRFLPDYPTYDHVITVEHLLTHTSGIKSYTSMPEWVPLWRKDFTVAELIAFFQHEPVQFAPGERYEYNNSGYFLLGAIIEKASGRTYAEFLHENIFAPLGMASSYYDDPKRIIPRRVSGYEKEGEIYVNANYLSMTQPLSAGALASSVDDLALWDAALYTDRLLKPETLRRAFTPARLADGTPVAPEENPAITYGYGWGIHELNGRPMHYHSGGIHGFLTHALRLPDERIFVAALSNNMSKMPADLANQIAALLL